MDTSETYIKMCEEAEEIQEQKKGHVMQSLHFDEHIDPVVGVWLTRRGEYYTGYNLGQRNEIVIWLPRQDQLQEMIGGFHKTLDILDHLEQSGLSAFMPLGSNTYPESWEQLWLAFVMKERYSKIWNGTGWKEE